eukprot:GEZU01011892.1.p1 GENE.GEZU01011892.1~~GEZU01011892.1.p1  ORF type:complete len:142 (-),score=35.71 GEZU01011892.1:187-612(-)
MDHQQQQIASREDAHVPSTESPSKEDQQQRYTNNDIHNLVEKMFEDIQAVAQGEMQVGLNELRLLEDMNISVSQRYELMHQRAQNIAANIANVKQKYSEFDVYFKQIDEIDNSVTALEKLVKHLDDYTKNLEVQLRPYLSQ